MNHATVGSGCTRDAHMLVSLEPMLKESVEQFLCQFSAGVRDFTDFENIFFRLLQTMPEPPLEIFWFCSAARFYSQRFSAQGSRNRFSATVSLYQLLRDLACSCNGVRRIATLSPVIYQLSGLPFFRERESDLEGFVDEIVRYICLCYATESNEYDRSIVPGFCFFDLIDMWIVEQVQEKTSIEDRLRIFLPFVSDRVHRQVASQYRLGRLASIVASQAFLLRLCLRFDLGKTRSELEKDLKDRAVDMITAFHNCYFLDVIFKMLLFDSVLPVTGLLCSEDEVFLREVLTDVVITAENLLINSGRSASSSVKCFKDLAITWVFIVYHTTSSTRTSYTKSIHYLKAFSGSCVTSYLMEWINEARMSKESSGPVICTPSALIERLLDLEDQGVRVFESDELRNHAKNVIFKSRLENVVPVFNPGGKNADRAICDLEMIDTRSLPSKKRKDDRIRRGAPAKVFRCNNFQEDLATQRMHQAVSHNGGLNIFGKIDDQYSCRDFTDMEL